MWEAAPAGDFEGHATGQHDPRHVRRRPLGCPNHGALPTISVAYSIHQPHLAAPLSPTCFAPLPALIASLAHCLAPCLRPLAHDLLTEC